MANFSTSLFDGLSQLTNNIWLVYFASYLLAKVIIIIFFLKIKFVFDNFKISLDFHLLG